MALWAACINSYLIIKDHKELKVFVPHEILDVDKSAPVSVVKKAYRKLSRVLHPDKNPDNPEAVT